MKTPTTKVAITDGLTGDVNEVVVPADDWLVICGIERDISGVQTYPNGTTVLTIKPVVPAPQDNDGRQEADRG